MSWQNEIRTLDVLKSPTWDGRTDGGDCNIPDAFLKKRGDKKERARFHGAPFEIVKSTKLAISVLQKQKDNSARNDVVT